ncbi:MAG: hypothetical protein AB7G62_09620 [Magnetospirillum sp.]
MLSLTDCVAFSGLTPEQLDAVACFKHVPTVVAAEWAETVLDQPDGCDQVEAALQAEVQLAHDHHLETEQAWEHGLDDFRHEHPHD